MLWKQQQIKCHIIPGDMGTALQPLRNEWCVANTWQPGNRSLFESRTLSHFISYLLFAETSVTGKELRKQDFCSDCSRILFRKHPVCSVHMQHGGFRMFSLTANGLDSWEMSLSSFHGSCLAENTECQVTPACVLSAASPHPLTSPSFPRSLC